MGTANVRAIKDMGSDINNPYFVHNELKIFTIFDVPHLLKCFRKYNILLPTVTFATQQQLMQARWSDIKIAYEQDKKNPLIFRSLHKLKDFYLYPVGQTAMKVKVAAQTLSRTVSVYLYNLVQQNILPPRSLATATFIQEMDELFDSLNASARVAPDGKPFKCIVSEESGHTSFWEDAFRYIP
ncbi:uncharacterized protein LOC130902990 [Diorhabda carinulata]|uniref:uncharacterized protein LOC130902990 n=2 Tax=Diorhabda carinulata TaxID=1163345 RepID=UPI0025A0D691|nr:uncharacterized protein LOC130902990 [Diorhabda carinulata]